MLCIVIVFLVLSSIFLFKRDKINYVYDLQTTESRLAGKEFQGILTAGFETLRLSLGSINPNSPINDAQNSKVKNIIENQNSLAGALIQVLDVTNGSLKNITYALNDQALKRDALKPADFVIKKEQWKDRYQDLQKNKYLLFNISRVGSPPLMAVVLADLGPTTKPTAIPIITGFASLATFSKDIQGSNIAVCDVQGRILFDANSDRMMAHEVFTSDPLFNESKKATTSSGAMEFDADNDHFLGSFFKPGDRVIILTRMQWKRALWPAYQLAITLVIIGLGVIGIGIVFGVFFSKSLTAPLNRLMEATKQVAAGHFNLTLQPGSRDEIGVLSGSFNIMSQKIDELIKDSMERVRLEGELEIAQTVQKTLFPAPRFQNQNIMISSHYQSASECGGDWWGFFTAGSRTVLLIADATGHGIPSALITSAARSCFSVINKIAQENPTFPLSPAALLSFANRVIYDSAQSQIMMTFFCGIIDFSKHTITYASAGHNPPWLFQKGANGFTLKSLTAKGQRLGESPNAPRYEEKTAKISTGDILFLYTDGVTEGKNKAGEMFGKKTVKKIVEANLQKGPDGIISNLMNAFNAHNGEKPLDDDVTLAAAVILPPPATGTH